MQIVPHGRSPVGLVAQQHVPRVVRQDTARPWRRTPRPSPQASAGSAPRPESAGSPISDSSSAAAHPAPAGNVFRSAHPCRLIRHSMAAMSFLRRCCITGKPQLGQGQLSVFVPHLGHSMRFSFLIPPRRGYCSLSRTARHRSRQKHVWRCGNDHRTNQKKACVSITVSPRFSYSHDCISNDTCIYIESQSQSGP